MCLDNLQNWRIQTFATQESPVAFFKCMLGAEVHHTSSMGDMILFVGKNLAVKFLPICSTQTEAQCQSDIQDQLNNKQKKKN
jgi:hypothetical protein